MCGGREFDDFDMIIRCLDSLESKHGISLIIEGGAKGADAHAAIWADNKGIPRVTMYANWRFHDKSAGPIRNSNMIKLLHPDCVVAFKGDSGTKNMCSLARSNGIKLWETWKGQPKK